MNRIDAFAYNFDEELVRSVLPDWPAGVGVLLCLKADGSCRTVLFHTEEGVGALRRAAEVMDLPSRGFAVTPEVKGWPTRHIRFSEEQDMLNLVVGVDGIVEMAVKYEETYQAEKEARRNPPRLVAGVTKAKAVAPSEQPLRRLNLGLSKADLIEKVRRRPVEVVSNMPAGFTSGNAKRDCQFSVGHIGGIRGYIRVALAPELVTIKTSPIRVDEIGFSSDFWRFYLTRAALEGWVPGQPAVIDIPIGAFPDALSRVLVGRLFHVDATITPEGIFLAPGAPVEPAALAYSGGSPKPAAKPRRRWLTPLRAAAVCAVAGTAAAAVTIVPRGLGDWQQHSNEIAAQHLSARAAP